MAGFDTPDDLSDDDPEVVAGMERYRELKAAEAKIKDLPARE